MSYLRMLQASKATAAFQRSFPLPDSHEDVKRRLASLTPGHRGLFDYWLEAFVEKGSSREDAERGALAKTLNYGPIGVDGNGGLPRRAMNQITYPGRNGRA